MEAVGRRTGGETKVMTFKRVYQVMRRMYAPVRVAFTGARAEKGAPPRHYPP